jgi:hypothetical protein
VAKVRAFELPGFDLWFNSEDHLPPHFHVEKAGDWEIKVHFMRHPDEMLETVWPKNPKRKGNQPRPGELRAITGKAEEHRAELLEEWQRGVHVKDPGPAR